MMSMTMKSVSFQRSSLTGTRVQSAPRRAPAVSRAVRMVRAGPDRGDDTWGKGQDEQAKTVEQSAAPSGDRAVIGQKAQPTGSKANEEAPSENMGATGTPEERKTNDGYDDDELARGRPS